jgi:hypothetical protein
MTKVLIDRPLKELDRSDELRPEPSASFMSSAVSPSPHLPFPDSGRFLNGHFGKSTIATVRKPH